MNNKILSIFMRKISSVSHFNLRTSEAFPRTKPFGHGWPCAVAPQERSATTKAAKEFNPQISQIFQNLSQLEVHTTPPLVSSLASHRMWPPTLITHGLRASGNLAISSVKSAKSADKHRLPAR